MVVQRWKVFFPAPLKRLFRLVFATVSVMLEDGKKGNGKSKQPQKGHSHRQNDLEIHSNHSQVYRVEGGRDILPN